MAADLPPRCAPCGFRHEGGPAAHAYTEPAYLLNDAPSGDLARLELVNIRQLVIKHGVREADGNGELRSTVAMVEAALVARPPLP